VGFSQAEQAALERLFVTASALPQSPAPTMSRAGRYWQDAALDCGDAALLLFCPLRAADAASEAAWRLLAHFYQGAFFQRLRSELQLGYAVFCGFRQVGAQRGILFAVQSPHASTQDILGHIEGFLQIQGQRLASLSEADMAAAAAEQGRQLRVQASNPADFAEQQWLLHLAGLPELHAAALHRALAQCARQDLLHQHHALSQAHGGWYVLANSRRPGSGWMTPS
jgi:secreted Zn-dependent insulinase-like peptidase